MDSEILNVAEYAVEQPGVSGYICVDKNGLCIAAQGQASESMSGIIRQISDLADKMEEPGRKTTSGGSKSPPVIRVDLERQKILIKSCEDITTALFLLHK